MTVHSDQTQVPDIDQLDLLIDKDGVEWQGGESWTSAVVLGEPFHQSPQDLLEAYKDQPLADFLDDEARYACGNYVLFDPRASAGPRIITSPAYAGGYSFAQDDELHISTRLGSLLDRLSPDDTSLDPVWAPYFVENSMKALPPHVAPFSSISRLPPGSLIDVNQQKGKVEVHDVIFKKLNPRSAPSDLGDPLDEVGQTLSDRDVTVMFSGGIDSLCLYLAVADAVESGSCRAVSVDWRPGSTAQGPFQAQPVADMLSIDLEVLRCPMGWPPSSGPSHQIISQAFSNDLILPFAPHYALTELAFSPHDVVLHGQNMDATVGIGMKGPSEWLPILHIEENLLEKVWKLGWLTLHRTLPNIQYTDLYLNKLWFAWTYLHLLQSFYRFIHVIKPECSRSEFVSPAYVPSLQPQDLMMSVGENSLPNLVRKGTPQAVRDHYLTAVDQASEVFGSHRQMARYFKYRTYSEGANKALSGGGPYPFPRPNLAAMWSPILSFFNAIPNAPRDAIFYKWRLNEYVEDKTGFSYGDLKQRIYGSNRGKERVTSTEYKVNLVSPFLQSANAADIMADLCAACPSLEPMIEQVEGVLTRGEGSFGEIEQGHRILNVASLWERLNE